MPIYKAPLEDLRFLFDDIFQIDRYDTLPGFSDASADVREAFLAEAAKLAENVLQPLNRAGETSVHLARLQTASATVMELPAEAL